MRPLRQCGSHDPPGPARKARRHRRSQVPLAPDLTPGLAATATVTAAQQGPQPAAATVAALAGPHASWGPRLIAAGPGRRTRRPGPRAARRRPGRVLPAVP